MYCMTARLSLAAATFKNTENAVKIMKHKKINKYNLYNRKYGTFRLKRQHPNIS